MNKRKNAGIQHLVGKKEHNPREEKIKNHRKVQ